MGDFIVYNAEFWIKKLNRDAKRDFETIRALKDSGWRIAIVWECAWRLHGTEAIVDEVRAWSLRGGKTLIVPREPPPAF